MVAIDQASPTKWGIVGTGVIATAFARDLRFVPTAEIVAVGSRAIDTARAFAERFDIKRSYGSYDDLLADDNVQVIYVATPHAHHYATARSALESGKHVLCEKPFTLDQAQADEIITVARSHGLFLMEAMWTRFLPHMRRIREFIAAGAIGDIRLITADFGARFEPDAAHRLFNPDLGGGALLDLGIYPLSLSSMLLGPPQAVQAFATPAFTGVDASTTVLLTHGNGAHSVLACTVEADTSCTAVISGTHGRIEIDAPFYAPTSFTLSGPSGNERFSFAEDSIGLSYEAEEVGRCLRAGLLESPMMPLDETSAIMRTVDAIRHQSMPPHMWRLRPAPQRRHKRARDIAH
jgi:predicted dehydrogenase